MTNTKSNIYRNSVTMHVVLCIMGIYTLGTATLNSMQLAMIWNINASKNEIGFLPSLITFLTEFGTLAYFVILLLFVIKRMVKHLFIRFYLILFSLYSALLCGYIQLPNVVNIINESGIKAFLLNKTHVFDLTYIVVPLIFSLLLINSEIRGLKGA